MDNRGKVESVGAFVQCSQCFGGVLFVIGPKEKPDIIYQTNIPIAIAEKFIGVRARCNRCKRMCRAFVNWHSMPPMLNAIADGEIDQNET